MGDQDLGINDAIFSKLSVIMERLNQNRKLQELAQSNGIDVKNSVQLTEATTNNIAVSVVALMLAQQEGDPDYKALVRAGMNHRKIKTELINKYKNRANQMLDMYKTQMKESADPI